MRVDTRHRPSSAAFCPLHRSGACRSCPHQGIPLVLQLARKQQRVARLLPPIDDDTWQSPVPSARSAFRNKAKMAVSGRAGAPVLGVLDRAGRGTDLRSCPVHVPAIRRALPVLARLIGDLRLIPYDVSARRGELKHLLVTASPDGDLMIRFVLRSRRHLGALRRALPRLRRDLPTIAVVSVNLQPVHQAVIEGEKEIVLTDEPGGDRLLMRLVLPGAQRAADGEGALTGRSAGARVVVELPLLLPTRSFFQTNTGVTERLYATARAWADDVPAALPRPAEVWDLFCGVGGFALALARPGRRVLGVEISAPAIAGARDAAALMGLEPAAARFETGDARVLAPGTGVTPDLLVVNPPRRGIGADLAGRIEESGVPRVLYSSCNPASLAADLACMPSLRARRARLFDMFPHTDHAEVLVELVR